MSTPTCCAGVPALPLHACHSQVLPSRVQEVHLLPDFSVLLLTEVSLCQQGSTGPEDSAHAALVGGQLHHVALKTESRKHTTNLGGATHTTKPSLLSLICSQNPFPSITLALSVLLKANSVIAVKMAGVNFIKTALKWTTAVNPHS